jgi:hypothetical protein
MQGAEIIQKFELLTDDTTELSGEEELALANKVLRDIYDIQPWEFLRKAASGTVSATGITIPTDFLQFMLNYSEDNTSTLPDTAVVYINDRPYRIIPMGNRVNYPGADVCWFNPAAGKIEFRNNPAGATYAFDYKYLPADITLATEPIIPTSHYLVVYGMLIDDELIQRMGKENSNMADNSALFNRNLTNLKHHNAKMLLV